MSRKHAEGNVVQYDGEGRSIIEGRNYRNIPKMPKGSENFGPGRYRTGAGIGHFHGQVEPNQLQGPSGGPPGRHNSDYNSRGNGHRGGGQQRPGGYQGGPPRGGYRGGPPRGGYQGRPSGPPSVPSAGPRSGPAMDPGKAMKDLEKAGSEDYWAQQAGDWMKNKKYVQFLSALMIIFATGKYEK